MFKHGLIAAGIALAAAPAMISLTTAPAVIAETLPAPKGDVLLTVSGAMANETSDGVVALDLAALTDMGGAKIETSTIWTEGNTQFIGTPLKSILNYAGITGQTIEAVALNDYKVDIPVAEITDDFPIVAYEMNGEAMSPRGKGPLWIVYPYDDGAEYRTEVTYSRSIWQLDRIVSK